MRLATIQWQGSETAAIMTTNGALPIEKVNEKDHKQWATDLLSILKKGHLKEIKNWWKDSKASTYIEDLLPLDDLVYGPIYRHPRKIWGIGLNYQEHAADLKEKSPETEPASFMKPDTTIIGPKETIFIPHQSHRTTAEAELGVVIGEKCKDISVEEAPQVVAGFISLIDMTAEDILEKNPRYLTRAKSFDTFLSLGPHLVTPDEIEDLDSLEVATVINGKVHRKNKISEMMFHPWHLVSFHSKVMTLLPGDIICTGTPGAAVIQDQDVVACQIDHFKLLENNVRDLKYTRGKENGSWTRE